MSGDSAIHPGRWWHALPDGRIQCDLCPRDCRLHEGQRGACFVRQRIGDAMVLTTYGRSSGFCIDPIEKKPLNHFYPGSSVFSFGTAGCNLACKFCQNWDISKSREMDTLMDSASPEAIAETALRLGCRSVAYTYNDPVIFAEYAMDCADACRARGIASVAVTAGYIGTEARRDFYAKMDAANVDLKGFTDEFYVKLCGARLQPVLDTLVYLKHESDVWFEITTLLIPGKNDSPAEIEAMSAWVVRELGKEVPLHFTAFHPDYKLTDIERTPASTLTRARDIALKAGIRYVYTGNVHDRTGGTTFCPACGKGVIVRDWHEILHYDLTDDGRCSHCDARLPGRFEAFAGQWGRRRVPVRVSVEAAGRTRARALPAARGLHSARDHLPILSMGCLARACVLVMALASGAASAQGAPHDPDGYRNNYPHADKQSFWAWKLEQWRDGLPPKPPPGGWNIPYVMTDAAALRAPEANPSVTWIGHATMFVRLAGKNILFDPVFAERASPVSFAGPKRIAPLPIDIGELPRIDVVLISHNHYDHLDADTVTRLAAMGQGGPRFLVPLGLKAWFATLGITKVDEYDWWQETREGDLKITFVPVQHWSKRRFDDANQTLWGGWVVEGEGLRLIHTGDTGFSKDFRDIGNRLGPFDMAFIPIGAYAPRWFMQVMHVDVPEAVQIREDLKAARAIGMHWGTFEGLTDEPLDEPPRELAKQRAARGLAPVEFDVLKIGETRRLEQAAAR